MLRKMNRKEVTAFVVDITGNNLLLFFGLTLA